MAQRGSYSRVPWDLNNPRDSFWQPTTPKAPHRLQTETHLQPFCERGLLACPRASALGAGFSFGMHLEAMEVLSGNTGQGMPSSCCLSAILQLTSISQKITYTFIWSPDFHNCHSGKTSRFPGSGDQQALYLLSHRTI